MLIIVDAVWQVHVTMFNFLKLKIKNDKEK